MITTQYQQSIRVLQSDNGRKYLNGLMTEFLTTDDIRNQTS